jgi:hypothetical protein
MKSKIIKESEWAEMNVSTELSQDLGYVQARAMIYSIVSDGQCDFNFPHNICDIEIDFSVNNQRCNYKGFKELYKKLFGEKKFDEFYDKLAEDFEEAYYKLTSYK